MSWPREGHIVKGKAVEIQLPWRTLTTNSKEGKFFPAGAWSLLGDYSKIRAWGELAGATGDIQVTPAIQVAVHPNKPGAVVKAPEAFDKDGVFEATAHVGIKKHGDAPTYVRVGWLVASPSGEIVHVSASGMIELSADEE